jgi:hypothetical protein
MGQRSTARVLLCFAIALPPSLLVLLLFSRTAGLVLFAVLGLFHLFVGLRNGLLVAGGLVAGCLLVVAAAGLLPDPDFRPHEKHALEGRYRPHVRERMRMPFGDLVALSGDAFAHVAEPREVAFATDGRGFPNAREFEKGQLLLVGDSFVAGNSMSLEDMIGAKLESLLGRPVYTAAFPGDILAYMDTLEEFQEPGLVFVFEGNDFATRCEAAREKAASFGRLLDRARGMVPAVAKVHRLRKRVAAHLRLKRREWLGGRGQTQVALKKVRGIDVLFHAHYVDTTSRAAYEFEECVVERVARTRPLVRALFFLPTKYRLYRPSIDGEAGKPLPDANWQALRRLGERLSIPTYDLTPALAAGAAAALDSGRFVYWRDDSHWNGLGTEIVAREVARLLGLGR